MDTPEKIQSRGARRRRKQRLKKKEMIAREKKQLTEKIPDIKKVEESVPKPVPRKSRTKLIRGSIPLWAKPPKEGID